MSKPLPPRNELLAALIYRPSMTAPDETLLDDASRKLHEILNASNSPALVEWLFNQLLGPPRTVVQQVIESEELIRGIGRVASRHLPADKVTAFVSELVKELGEAND